MVAKAKPGAQKAVAKAVKTLSPRAVERVKPPFSPIEEALAALKAGRMIVVVDDEDRENEGDLIIPAQMATPEAVNFMAKHGRGLICLAMTRQRVEHLRLSCRNGRHILTHAAAHAVVRHAAAFIFRNFDAGFISHDEFFIFGVRCV